MEEKLKNLKTSMDNTLLSQGMLNSSQERKIFLKAIDRKKTGNLLFFKPLLAVAMSGLLLFVMGTYISNQVFITKNQRFTGDTQ